MIQSWQLSALCKSDRVVVAATGLSLHVLPGWRVAGRAFAVLRLGPGGGCEQEVFVVLYHGQCECLVLQSNAGEEELGCSEPENAAFRAGKEGVRASRSKDVRELEESWFWEWFGGEFEAVDIFREIVRIFRIVRKLAIN